jgi:hypothetical protein
VTPLETVPFEFGRAVPFHVARDPVNVPMMRRWCDVMGVRHGVHTDPGVAGRSRFGRVVAPLAMLDVWTNPGLAYQRGTDPTSSRGITTTMPRDSAVHATSS